VSGRAGCLRQVVLGDRALNTARTQCTHRRPYYRLQRLKSSDCHHLLPQVGADSSLPAMAIEKAGTHTGERWWYGCGSSLNRPGCVCYCCSSSPTPTTRHLRHLPSTLYVAFRLPAVHTVCNNIYHQFITVLFFGIFMKLFLFCKEYLLSCALLQYQQILYQDLIATKVQHCTREIYRIVNEIRH